MPRAPWVVLALFVGACPGPKPVTGTVDFAASPSLTSANPFAPVVARLHFSSGACDLDPATIDGSLTLTPAPATTARFVLNPVACALSLVVPDALAPGVTYTATLAPKLETTDGHRLAPPAQSTLTFTVDLVPGASDDAPPEFVGTWPPAGDERVASRAPVHFFFSAPLASVATVDAPAGARASVEPGRDDVVVTPAEGWPVGSFDVAVSGLASRTGAAVDAPPALALVHPDSTDEAPPSFAGAGSVDVDAAARTVAVGWDAATDGRSAPDAIRYLVFVTPPGATFDWSIPTFVTAPGATSATLGLSDGGFDVAVRAEDEVGNVDGNTVRLEAR